MPVTRACPECKKEVQGRVNKIFCDGYCRSAFHYRKKQDNNDSLYRQVDLQIKLNRRLLKHFNQAGKSTIRAEKLLGAGFDPSYFTHYWKTQEGKIYLFCYDIGFLRLKEHGKDKYVLVDWQQYMVPGMMKSQGEYSK